MSSDGAGTRALTVLALAGMLVFSACAGPEDGQPTDPADPTDAPVEAPERLLESEWTVDASSIAEGGVFVRPARLGPSPVSDAPTGAHEVGDVLVTTVRSDVNSSEYTSAQVPEQVLVALDRADGEVLWTQQVTGALTCAEDEIEGLLPCLVGGDPHEPGTGTSPAPSEPAELRFYRLSDGEVASSFPAEAAREVAVSDGSVFLAWQDPYDQPDRAATITRGSIDDPEGDWRREYPLNPDCDTGVQGFWLEAADGVVLFRGEQSFVASADDGTRTPDESLYSVARVPGHGYIVDLCESGNGAAIFTLEGEEVARYDDPGNVISVVSRSGSTDSPVYLVNGAALHDFETGELLWDRDPRYFWVLGIVGDVALASGSAPGGPTLGLDARTGEQLWSSPFGEFGWVLGAVGDDMVTRGHNPSEVAGIALDKGERVWSFEVPDVARVDMIDDGVVVSTAAQLVVYSTN
ncbi:PQQ-binding-like beta-propeller repeat protein [Hoyosella altamirensis]|uniref:Outer membrane protein assembly factor BamB n=1 Tax=Hoyosella altamirensis TaxID=616997 RepID=A0A839RMW0_9ACTN|nr:PQQ-binding-like beta-propeller repeat protein [Hoyosella altamirensis]MBB3037353.1 outer membrane protein assembly factor BamB [Hoyosella altamirensis]